MQGSAKTVIPNRVAKPELKEAKETSKVTKLVKHKVFMFILPFHLPQSLPHMARTEHEAFGCKSILLDAGAVGWEGFHLQLADLRIPCSTPTF